LAAAGARVVVSARRLADAEAVAVTLPVASARPSPATSPTRTAIEALVEVTRAKFGPPTILVNNAGVIQPIGRLHESRGARMVGRDRHFAHRRGR